MSLTRESTGDIRGLTQALERVKEHVAGRGRSERDFRRRAKERDLWRERSQPTSAPSSSSARSGCNSRPCSKSATSSSCACASSYVSVWKPGRGVHSPTPTLPHMVLSSSKLPLRTRIGSPALWHARTHTPHTRHTGTREVPELAGIIPNTPTHTPRVRVTQAHEK